MMAAWPLYKIKRGKTVFLAGIALAAAWILYPYFLESSVPVRPLTPAIVKPVINTDGRPMPKGFEQAMTIGDPFRMSQAVLPLASVSDQSAPMTAAPYRVTGIAIGNQMAAAILESKEGSRSYRIGDYAGQYQIREITPDFVFIVGPNESHRLNLKRGI